MTHLRIIFSFLDCFAVILVNREICWMKAGANLLRRKNLVGRFLGWPRIQRQSFVKIVSRVFCLPYRVCDPPLSTPAHNTSCAHINGGACNPSADRLATNGNGCGCTPGNGRPQPRRRQFPAVSLPHLTLPDRKSLWKWEERAHLFIPISSLFAHDVYRSTRIYIINYINYFYYNICRTCTTKMSFARKQI